MSGLLFLPTGDMALTRRSKEHSKLHAVVLKWSKVRKRYERKGLLIDESVLVQAEVQCLADAEMRERRRIREAERRALMDKEYVREYGEQIKRYYPHVPSGLEVKIAEHACLKHSGRIWRSREAKRFD